MEPMFLQIFVEIQWKCQGQNKRTTQNILAAITFDLKFTYVLAEWKGNAHAIT